MQRRVKRGKRSKQYVTRVGVVPNQHYNNNLMAKNLGKSYSLWSLAGWFKPAPTNLSKQERETVNRMQSGLSSPLQGGMQEYYMGQTSRNSDPQQHFGEMEEMAGHEIVAPVLAIYAE